MIRQFAVITVLIFTGALVAASPQPTAAGGERCRPAAGKDIDLVLCLDTSGSMSGLINATRQKLWVVVNDLATAQPTPHLRVALLTYGNDGLPAATGWVGVETDFTDDLDEVSERLFALTTNGGTEYVGRVLDHTKQLDWSRKRDALQLVIVAGNESADQDQEVPYRQACKMLISRGIMVNAIYCGNAEDGIAPEWRRVAELADGKFASIDQDNGTVVVESPFDIELSKLSGQLNQTFLAYGAKGEAGRLNQAEQDKNAGTLGVATEATRAQAKASKLYKPKWDLVDAVANDDVDLKELKAKDLPEPMRAMSDAERERYVKKMAVERVELQKRIAELGKRRDAFVKAELQRLAVDESNGLDYALRGAIREQAQSKGFSFGGVQ